MSCPFLFVLELQLLQMSLCSHPNLQTFAEGQLGTLTWGTWVRGLLGQSDSEGQDNTLLTALQHCNERNVLGDLYFTQAYVG